MLENVPVTYVVLDNVRSAHNVGAIFRTCEGAGVQKIFLCGYTPVPIDRFGREVAEIKKTSLGASQVLEWEQCDDVLSCIQNLSDADIEIVAVEQVNRSVSVYTWRPPSRVAYVFGNEVIGVDDRVCKMASQIIHIPMRGMKESLNVSTCVGVVLFQPWEQLKRI